jgi:hypothetical protein
VDRSAGPEVEAQRLLNSEGGGGRVEGRERLFLADFYVSFLADFYVSAVRLAHRDVIAGDESGLATARGLG